MCQVSGCLVVHVEMGGRTIILHANQGCHEPNAESFKGRTGFGDIGPRGGAEIGGQCPKWEEELEDVIDGFGSHGESEEISKEALR